MSFLRNLMAEMDELVASGEFAEPNVEHDQAMEEVITKITDSDLKALFTLFRKYRAFEESAARDLHEKIMAAKDQIIAGGPMPDIVAARNKFVAAYRDFRIVADLAAFEMTRVLGVDDSDADMAVLRAGWLVVKHKAPSPQPQHQPVRIRPTHSAHTHQKRTTTK